MPVRSIAACLPKELSEAVETEAENLTEIRLRANRRAQLILNNSELFCANSLSAEDVRRIALRLMNHSYYACETEMARGFFTMRGGNRVGICGTFAERDGKVFLQKIGSICIRIPREVRGCAREAVECMLKGNRLSNLLVASPPGMGKTTLLRDMARLLSQRGFRVGIADERSEIAACIDGIPSLDVGERTDVTDGCCKEKAMEMLIRSMSPQVIITDEIGGAADIDAVREAARSGVSVAASVHTARFEDLERGSVGCLLKDGIFQNVVLLGNCPGKICEIRSYGGCS